MMNFVWIMTLTIQTILLLYRLVSKFSTVDETFEVNFGKDVKTFFNNSLQSNGELIEILDYFDRSDRRVSRNLSSKTE